MCGVIGLMRDVRPINFDMFEMYDTFDTFSNPTRSKLQNYIGDIIITTLKKRHKK